MLQTTLDYAPRGYVRQLRTETCTGIELPDSTPVDCKENSVVVQIATGVVDRLLDTPSRVLQHWVEGRSDGALALWLAAGVTLLFFLSNIMISGPVYSADEGGYLANAAAIAGFRVEAANRYHGGYSLLVAPLFWLISSPEAVYTALKLLNAVLWGSTSATLYCLFRRVFDDKPAYQVLSAVVLAALYPAWLAGSGYALSGSAFALVFVLGGSALYKAAGRGGIYWPLSASLMGFLYWIHPTALPVVGTAVLLACYIAFLRQSWGWFLCFLMVAGMMILAYHKLFGTWLSLRMTPSDAGVEDVQYASFLTELYKLLDPAVFTNFMAKLAGHLAYIGLATLGLAFLPVIHLVQRLRARDPAFPLSDEFLILCFFCLSTFSVLLMSTTFFSIFNVYRLDHWMYGRYVEGTAIGIIALGALFWNSRNYGIAILLVLACLAGLYLGLAETAERYVIVNGLGLWQPVISRFNFANEAPSAAIFRWGMAGLFLMGVLWLLWNRRVKYLFVLACFLATSAVQVAEHYRLTSLYSEPKYKLASVARELFPSFDCVNMDVAAWSVQSSWLSYAFFFHDNDFTRYKVENWPLNCPGPLLSPALHIDHVIAGSRPFAFNRYDGLILWAPPAQNVESSRTKQDCPLLSCMNSSTVSHSQVGRHSADGINSTGRAGFLVHRQYAPMRAGEYRLLVNGQVAAHGGDVRISVVSSQDRKVYAEFVGVGQGAQEFPVLLDERVVLSQDITALEIRIHISAGVGLTLRDYSFRRTGGVRD